MTSEELAEKIAGVCKEATSRVTGVGHQSYVTHVDSAVGPRDHQRYEIETLDDQLTGLEEELLDTINWAAMAVLKIREKRDT